VAGYDAKKVRSLLADAGIVRNRLKISATIDKRARISESSEEFGSFDIYIWQICGRQAENATDGAHAAVCLRKPPSPML